MKKRRGWDLNAGLFGFIGWAASSALTACRGTVRQAAAVLFVAQWLFAKGFGVPGETWEKASREEGGQGTTEDEAATACSGKDFRIPMGKVMSEKHPCGYLFSLWAPFMTS